jgi:hypothetical protein
MNIRWLVLLISAFFCLLVPAQDDFSSQSVLSSGTWYRVKVEETGIYKITYEDLAAIGFDSPQNIRIYGNGGEQLSYSNDEPFKDDLQEIALYQSSNSGFGPGDYFLFYGEGAVSWSYSETKGMYLHHLHEYSESNYYYITSSFGAGKRIQQIDNSSLSTQATVTEYDYRVFHETESRNLINSGRRWFGESFSDQSLNISFNLNEIVSGTDVNIYMASCVRSAANKAVSIKANSTQIAALSFSHVLTTDKEAKYADVKEVQTKFTTNSSDIIISHELLSPGFEDLAYLDFIVLNSRSKLTINAPAFFFRDKNSIAPSSSALFRLSNANANIKIWNITNHNNIFEIKGSLSGSNLEFRDSVSSINEYVAVDVKYNFGKPVFTDQIYNDVGWISEKQNLHGLSSVELLVVTHPDFLVQAEELAKLHREKDNMNVAVVTTEQVYNEFSSGKTDASAIRNLARMLYERASIENPFKYLLLFGDGSYDNRGRNIDNPNYIPTYQSSDGTSPTYSYSTDDLYAMLEVGEWSSNGTLDIGVGRIPVKSTENQTEAQGVINKIKTYYDPSVMKDWRNKLIFLGDDGESGWDNKIFMVDSDSLTKIIERCEPTMNFTKIYLDAYQQISSSTGAAYPEVENALSEAFKKGALIFNYMGHGGEGGITQEKVLQKGDFEALTNGPYYPLFMTATCQLSRFDNVVMEESGAYSNKTSAGEAAFLNPKGGAIAMFTTTRLVYQSSNYRLSQNVYNNMFSKDENGNRFRLGDIIRIAKNKTTDSSNKFKFALLGDPAITLAYGEHKVITDSINSIFVENKSDTVRALGNMIISGYVATDDSTLISDFNGIVQVNVFDKEYIASTRGNDGIPTFDFTMRDKLLFRGKATVKNGRFDIEFKIPKDISYSYGKGKITYYAQNGIIDAKGYHEDFYVGGTAEYVEPDSDGPQITLFMNDSTFKEGGLTNANPVLLAHIFDESGINTTGNGIGHNISGVLDNDYSTNLLLNDYYEGELDDFRSGKLLYPLNDLEEGTHEILVKVWDTYNNSSEELINFYVKQSDNGVVIDKVFNYPNPMQETTTFQYSHNMPGEHEVQLKIYDLTGRVIYIYEETNIESGFVSQPITWERNTASGGYLMPGVYPYRLNVKVTQDAGLEIYSGNQDGRLIIIP